MRFAGSTKGVDSMPNTAISTNMESRETTKSTSKALVMMYEKCNIRVILAYTLEVSSKHFERSNKGFACSGPRSIVAEEKCTG
jgi:hypothetical protein